MTVEARTHVKFVSLGDHSGRVFFDNEWDAYGWETTEFTNGPFDSLEEAEEALGDELRSMADDLKRS